MTRWILIGGIALAALLQTAALAKMIQDRAALLRGGQEVVLQTGMIDPRDLFRGHYTIVNLTISRLDITALDQVDLPDRGEPVFVTLAPGEAEFWVPVAVDTAPPTTDAPVLRGTFRYASDTRAQIDFPFDRYFAPKERAQELENLRNDGALGLILAVGPDGGAAVKGITVAGEPFYIEPLY